MHNQQKKKPLSNKVLFYFLFAFSALFSLQLKAQYCTPSNTACIILMNQVSITSGFTNNTIGDSICAGGAYRDFTAITANVAPGLTYVSNVKVNTNSGSAYFIVIAWADWNNDKIFADDESTVFTRRSPGTADLNFDGQIMVPADALIGTTRIRYRLYSANSNPVPLGPCGNGARGEIEDYTLNVTGAAPPAPTYCASSGNCGPYGIKQVKVTGDNATSINNSSTCVGYQNFTDKRVTMSSGGSYVMTVSVTSTTTASNAVGVALVDWDNNGVFDENTEAVTSGFVNAAFTFGITPPAASTGLKRMRIVTGNGSNLNDPSPSACGARGDGGETEDYSILYVAPLDTVPNCINPATAYPTNAATNICQKITFRWAAVTNAKGYKFSLVQGPTTIVDNVTVVGNSYTPAAALSPGLIYQWIAVPYSSNSSAIACDTLFFSTSANADPIADILPAFQNAVCQGLTLTLDGNPSLGTAPFNHSWNGPNNNPLSDTSIATPVFDANTALGNYFYTYTVADANGCKGLDSVCVTVTEKATAGSSVAVPSIVCSGEGSILTVTGSKGTLSWESAASASGPWTSVTLTSVNDSVFETGTLGSTTFFRVTATLGTCTEIGNTVEITVTPLPAKPIINLTTAVLCEGESVILRTTNYTDDISWDDAALTFNDSLEVNTARTFIATASANGCETQSDAVTVTVNPVPATPVIQASKNPACVGETVILSSSAIANNSWSNGSTTDQISVTSAGTFSVTQTNSFNCSATSLPVTVTFNALPPKPSITLPNLPLCEGVPAQLSTDNVGGNTWSNGSTTDMISISSTNLYAVTYTDANGCSATSDAVQITFNPLPAKPGIGVVGNFCEGTATLLLSSSTGNNTWSDGSTLNQLNITASGPYTVTVTDANGCSNTSDVLNASFDPIPATPTITQAGNLLTASAGGSSYQWYDDNGEIVGATSSTYTPTHGGNHYVVALSPQGCPSEDSDKLFFSGIGIFETKSLQSINLYPNPSSGTFSVNSIDLTIANSVRVTDLTGRVVFSKDLNSGTNDITVDVSRGTYLVEFVLNGTTVGQQRLVIQ